MKPIFTAAALFVTSFALISCGGKDNPGSEAEAEVSAKTHTEIGQEVADIMTEMMTGMGGIKDKASAEAFASSVPAIKDKMKALLKEAQALPAPTAEEKAAVDGIMKAAEEKAGPAMMAMMTSMATNPDAEAIGEVLSGVMEDEEMNKVGESLEALYMVEDAE